MNTEFIYNSLNSEQLSSEQRCTLISYLKERLEYLPSDELERQDIAYQIAGLMSTEYASSLSDADPLMQVFALASELELPIEQRSAATWDQLRDSIDKLQ